MVERLFLAVPRGCLQFVIVVFPDHTHLLFFIVNVNKCLILFFLEQHINISRFKAFGLSVAAYPTPK